MKVEQIYTGCLAEAAYFIESEGEAAIIDPLRETAPYLEKARAEGASIKYIFETHFHADFVSGHLDLAKESGAQIVYGPGAKAEYELVEAQDGQVFELGKVKIKVLHTPGHTLESSTYLLIDEEGKEHAIFTGDTLFIGDVGRPDLAVPSDKTDRDLAGLLFDSLREKIMPLADEVIIYPGHGAGSACGKNLSKETVDTLGNQKKVNYGLREDQTREEFIEELLDGILPPPQYFPKNAVINKTGYASIDAVMERGNQPLDLEAFRKLVQEEQALILDTRHQQTFNKGFIPGSLNIGLDGSFAVWVGTLVMDLNQPIVLITEPGREEESVLRLARVGYDNTRGYLNGGVASWEKAGMEVQTIESISPEALEAKLNAGESLNILDVRKPTEWMTGHLLAATSFPLDYIRNHIDKLDKSKTYYVHCAGGYRSMVTASYLRREGIQHVLDIDGGFKAIKAKTELPKIVEIESVSA